MICVLLNEAFAEEFAWPHGFLKVCNYINIRFEVLCPDTLPKITQLHPTGVATLKPRNNYDSILLIAIRNPYSLKDILLENKQLLEDLPYSIFFKTNFSP